jgi:hypothetical protein
MAYSMDFIYEHFRPSKYNIKQQLHEMDMQQRSPVLAGNSMPFAATLSESRNYKTFLPTTEPRKTKVPERIWRIMQQELQPHQPYPVPFEALDSAMQVLQHGRSFLEGLFISKSPNKQKKNRTEDAEEIVRSQVQQRVQQSKLNQQVQRRTENTAEY